MKKKTTRRIANSIDRTLNSSAFQALTIGIPFCAFKLLFGLLALRVS